ncbi:hypothetical protein F5B20DRAFT_535982 [Whalleya microplaca]|nr:hypothetical protein F5B20DRAFT_535982 [Whalleya microplaca]
MGRWSYLDSDDERLPEGMVRIGYDADDGTYTFRDTADGSVWESAPGNRYGRLTCVSRPQPKPAEVLPPAAKRDEQENEQGLGTSVRTSSEQKQQPPYEFTSFETDFQDISTLQPQPVWDEDGDEDEGDTEKDIFEVMEDVKRGEQSSTSKHQKGSSNTKPLLSPFLAIGFVARLLVASGRRQGQRVIVSRPDRATRRRERHAWLEARAEGDVVPGD